MLHNDSILHLDTVNVHYVVYVLRSTSYDDVQCAVYTVHRDSMYRCIYFMTHDIIINEIRNSESSDLSIVNFVSVCT